MEILTKQKVFTYTTALEWDGERRGLASAPGKPSLRVASPPEFKGHAGIWTPEDLLVASAEVCALMTYLAFATRHGLDIVAYESSATGTLEKADGAMRFTRIVVSPHITVARPEDEARARSLWRDAEAACLVANSLKAAVVGEPTIVVAEAGAVVEPEWGV